ncbi:acetylserotonin O-methyltransferase-like [Cornus florida]|uniref:acetylserotonin O-methyltransferase-like n=1 Tax=Cornus florida TaxID=4283 RepID=UPI002899DD30|nr:acetylserotonin O-methyltransferase-like [Cornus florida]
MEGETTREATNREEEEESQAQVDIWKYVFGFVDMAVVKCAIELGIADVLENHGGPMTLSELSSTLHCSPSALHRIMRFLVHRSIFKEGFNSKAGTIGYVQTPLSRLLMRHGKNSMAALVLLESSPAMLAPWHGLSSCVLANGSSAFEAANGEDLWGYAAANPAHSKLFDDAMACDARVAVPAIIDGCPELLDGLDSLVDVGGGDGTALSILVKAFPWVHGINFDLPHVVSAAPNCVGVKHIGGDMFESVPKADAAFLMWVLHDWEDEECIHILRKCREAIPNDKGKVIIVEAVIEEDEGDKLKYVRLMLDMVMMAHTNKGKERSLKEWAYVLGEAGFSRHNVKRIEAVQSIIEAYP